MDTRATFTAQPSIPDFMMLGWASQAHQYAPGEPGLTYEIGETPIGNVDCLVWRDSQGKPRGVLNHYPHQMVEGDVVWEEAGNFNVWVDPTWRRRGLAATLLVEARSRWSISLARQRWSESGAAWIARLAARMGWED